MGVMSHICISETTTAVDENNPRYMIAITYVQYPDLLKLNNGGAL